MEVNRGSTKRTTKASLNGNQDDMEERNDEARFDEKDILSRLHRRNLGLIERKFPKEGGLSLDEFVSTLLQFLDYNKDDEIERMEVTLNLIDLFKEIDVNGDETMEWEEFSNYIIELGLVKKDKTGIVSDIKSYFASETLLDKEKHENEIEKVHFFDFERMKYVFVLERNSSYFKVYDGNNMSLIKNKLAHKGSILAADYYQDENKNDLIVTTSDDLTINFWEASSLTLKQRISTPEMQLCVRYVNWNNGPSLIYTGGCDALIHYYDAKTLKPKGHLSGWNPFFTRDNQQLGHAGPITDILPIKNQNMLVTCATDAKICIWDASNHSYKKDLIGHDKGVFSLDWSEDYNFLFSAGLDHDVYVWNTYVKDKITTLKGHNHPLIGVKVCPDSPQVISADISGMVKVWDIRNFMEVQTFNVPCDELNTFCTTHPKKRIIVGARNLQVYEYDEPKDQYLTDEKLCQKIIFNKVMFMFITLHPNSIKLWDATNGKLLKTHTEISQAELTACCLDARERKLIVGDVNGRIYCINVQNGARMKKFEKHTEQITDLIYWVAERPNQAQGASKNGLEDFLQGDLRRDKDPRMISSSKGRAVKVHDDSSSETKNIRYRSEVHTKAVNGLTLNKQVGLAASYSDDGTIVLMSLYSSRQEGILKESGRNPNTQIKKAVFLTGYTYLVACDDQGRLTFWTVLPNKNKNIPIFHLQYKAETNTKSKENFPVSAMAFNEQNRCLYLGDDFGYVAIWDLTKILAKLDELTSNEDKMKVWRAWKEKETNTLMREGKESLSTHTRETLGTSPNHFGSEKTFTTEVDFPFEDLSTNDLVVCLHKKLHNDGITSIEVMEEDEAFATSSFDCCCYIWNNQGNKMGSLMIAQDKNWNLHLNVEKRELDNLVECLDLLTELQGKDYARIAKDCGLFKRPKFQKLYSSFLKRGKESSGETKDSGKEKTTTDQDDDLIIKENPNKISNREVIEEALQRIEKIRYGISRKTEILSENLDDKEMFNEEDEEDQDYNILNDLDFKTTQVSVVNKGLFKSKPLKSHVKLKFK